MYRSVDTPHYHVWTDALLLRQRARDASDKWNRGTFVRGTINTAWTAFEIAAEAMLNTNSLGMRFRERFDDAMDNAGIGRVDWGSGTWQRVMDVYRLRIDYTHARVPQARLFPEIEEADRAITVLREAVHELARLVGDPSPEWVNDNEILNAPPSGGFRAHANATVIKAGVDRDHPSNIYIRYVYQGKEHTSEEWPPGTDHGPLLDELLRTLRIPVSHVRAYQGTV